MANFLDSRQSINRAALAAIGSAANAGLDVILGNINTIFANKSGTGNVVFNNGPTLTNVVMAGTWTSSAVTLLIEDPANADLLNMRYNNSNFKEAFLASGESGNVFLSHNLTNSGTIGIYNYDLTGIAYAIGDPEGENNFAIYIAPSGTAGTTAFNFETTPIPAFKLDTNQNATFSGVVQIGAGSTVSEFQAYVRSMTLTGTSQAAFGADAQASSAATNVIIGYLASMSQASGISTGAGIGFESSTFTKGAGSSLNTFVDFIGLASLAAPATNNAVLSDNTSFAGSYFLNSSSGSASFLKGSLQLGTSLQLNGVTSGNVILEAAAITTSYTVKMPPSQGASATTLENDGSGNLSWVAATFPKVPTVQKFTSGSGTYTTPAGVLYIRVTMVGGGGGGGGGGTTGAGAGGGGGNTTFGTSLLAANGGSGGTYGGTNLAIVSGGTASLGSATGTAVTGASGGGGSQGSITTLVAGAAGGSSPFGGAGIGSSNVAGSAAATNSGSGGGGGSTNGSNANSFNGLSGAAGGYVDAMITSPSATYPYVVGAAGTAGTAGTSGNAGGPGGSGYIIVWEYYQ